MHEMCQAAVQNQLAAIAFTEHKEWAGDFHAPFDGVDNYFEQIEQCRRDFSNPFGRPLFVLSGVELGQPHEHEADAIRFLERHPFDVTIGSIHYLYGENIHDARCFRRRDFEQVLSDYFRSVEEMVLNFDLDILAHFDRILWRPTLLNIPYDIRRVELDVRNLFWSILKRDILLELNTKIFRSNPNWRQALTTMLIWYKQAGGEQVLINSDAHHTTEVCVNFDDAARLLAKVGLNSATNVHALNQVFV